MRKFLWMIGIFLNSLSFGQVREDFTDGDFSSNPMWIGDSSKFLINSLGQLQTRLSSKTDTNYLSLPSTKSINTIWEMFLQMDFDPSTSNLMRIYLMSDQVNLKLPLNGYFLQIGESGSLDSYDLYKQTGSSITKIIDGPAKARSYVDSIKTNIRIARNIEGEWILYSRTDTTSSYQYEGSVTDKQFYKGNYFGLYTKSTSTRSNKFFFDNLNIETLSIDTFPPSIVHIDVESSNTITVQFDEELDSTNLFKINNYQIDKIQFPIQIIQLNSSVFQYVFNNNFTPGLHLFTAINIQDLNGNMVDSSGTSSNFKYIYHHIPQFQDIQITEIFPDPSPAVNLPSYEYIEIHNTTNYKLPLLDWTYSDGTTTFHFKNDSIDANNFLILCKVSDTSDFSVYGKVVGLNPWPSLNNNSDKLTLKDNTGLIIDSINYNLKFYKDKIKKNGGWSLEKIEDKTQCEPFYNWTASADSAGGTPGKRNSINTQDPKSNFTIEYYHILSDSSIRIYFNQIPDTNLIGSKTNYHFINELYFPNEIKISNDNYQTIDLIFKNHFQPNVTYKGIIKNLKTCEGYNLIDSTITFSYPNNDDSSLVIINEIFADPSPPINLPLAEFIELYNPNDSIVNLTGWEITDHSTSYIFDQTYIQPKEFLIVCNKIDSSIFSQFGKTKGIYPMINLANNGDSLQLLNKAKRLINEVNYNSNWYQSNSKKIGGYSLEKINIVAYCDDASNWIASIDSNGGSPGYLNSVANFYADTISLIYLKAEIQNDSNIVLKLNKGIRADLFDIHQIYIIDSSSNIISPISYQIDSPYNTNLLFHFNQHLANKSFKLFCNNLIICDDRSFNFLIPFYGPILAKNYHLKISEIMADPSPSKGLPEREYIEIINLSDSTIFTSGLTISDHKTICYLPIDSIKANGIAIICSQEDTDLFKSYGKAIGIIQMPSLNNVADTIYLGIGKNKILDSLTYNINQWGSNFNEGGFSLERTSNYWDCNLATLWSPSQNQEGGSPGTINNEIDINSFTPFIINDFKQLSEIEFNISLSSPIDNSNLDLLACLKVNHDLIEITSVTQNVNNKEIKFQLNQSAPKGKPIELNINSIHNCINQTIDTTLIIFVSDTIKFNDLILNEILFNPKPGSIDYIEIMNTSNHSIDLYNWSISNFEHSEKNGTIKVIPFHYYISSKELVCISENSELLKGQYPIKNEKSLIELPSMPTFNDDEGVFNILSPESILIDQFHYNEKMHLPILNSTEGVSLERRSEKINTENKNNWVSASSLSGYGTPTLDNSEKYDPSAVEEIFLNPKMFSPDQDGIDDYLNISYSFAEQNLLMNVEVFDRSGNFITELINNKTIGTKGIITWDGTNDSHLVDNGIYILSITLYNESGKIKSYKLPCGLFTRR